MGPACKIVINNGVAAMALATNEILKLQIEDDIIEAFDDATVNNMTVLDRAWMAAKHLLQVGDEQTAVLVAEFASAVAVRDAVLAEAWAEKLNPSKDEE